MIELKTHIGIFILILIYILLHWIFNEKLRGENRFISFLLAAVTIFLIIESIGWTIYLCFIN